MTGGLVGVKIQIEDKYYVHIIMLDGLGQTSDDYHATVTRLIDDAQLVYISNWKWLLKRKLRRRPLDRAFKRMDRREKKLLQTDEMVL